MENFDELLIRISTETAVLFLGQMFDQNVLFENIEDKYRQVVFGGEKEVSYSEAVTNLIKYCDEKPEEKNAIISSIIASQSTINDERFEKLASLNWNGVVTSLMHAIPGFDLLHSVVCPMDIKTDYFSKKNLKLTYLFGRAGNEQGNIPLSYEEQMKSETSKDQMWGEIVNRILLRGILIIDSWDPKYDWLKERDFNAFISCQKHTIYFFNLSDEAKRKPQIRKLISKEIAVVIEGSLYDWIQEKYIETEQYCIEENDEDSVEITIDSQWDEAEYSVKRLKFSILNQLDRSIVVLDDSILDNPNYLDRKEYFMRFLSTANLEPLWGGYSSGFYFKRDIDEELLEKVEYQLKNNDPAKSKVVLVEGRNASGKSACLGNLAFQLRRKKTYPVIYITSEMKDKKHFEQIFNLIRNHINEKLGARKTVVIWDRNTYDNDDTYDELRKFLDECNVVVVGSKYIVGDAQEKKNRNIDVVMLNDELSDAEIVNLKDALQAVDSTYASHFKEIIKTIEGASSNLLESNGRTTAKTYADRGNWFLMIMYRLFEDLHEIQQHSVKMETQSAEDAFIDWLEQYSNDKFYSLPFAKLYEDFGFVQPDRLDEYKKFVSEMYNMIAVAGKYGLELPAMVVYRAYSEDYAEDWGEFSTRIGRSSVIEMTQYEDGTLTFRFRRALMASLFLEEQVKNCTETADKELMDIEIHSLVKIIRNTNFNDTCDIEDPFSESIQVVNLIRKFGPNGPESSKYKNYFLEIADAINDANKDMNDEAILVASHLVREAFVGDPDDAEQNKPLLTARAKLHKAINRYARYNKSQQLSRLKVELCSNMLKSIHSKGQLTPRELDIFNQINEYIDDAMAIDLNRFSAGVFLDANLKVYPLIEKQKQKDKILSRMLQIVDDVKDAPYNDFGGNIYEKMLDVLDFAKKYKEIAAENEYLIKEGSDVGIYRQAMLGLQGYFFDEKPDEKKMTNIQETIRGLEKHLQIVYKNPRTLYLYIRLLWVSMTGRIPFTEKQCVNLSNDKWKKIADLCRRYVRTETAQKKAFPYFVNMINAFWEGNAHEYKAMIDITRKFRKKMPAHITFVVLCNEDGSPVMEDIKVVSGTNRNEVYSAEFQNPSYRGIKAYFKKSNFKDELDIQDGKPIKDALIGFNMYGVVVYGKSDLKLQIGGKN